MQCYPSQHIRTPSRLEGVRPHMLDQDDNIAQLNPGASDADLYEFMRNHFSADQEKRAKRAWAIHTAEGHPGRKMLGDALEHGCFSECNLTRADLDNAYKLFAPCAACLEGKFKLPSEPEADSVPAPAVAHTLYMDLFFHKYPTLGGHTIVLIATDANSGSMLHASVKRKTAECVEKAIIRIVSSLNGYGHKGKKNAFCPLRGWT